MQQKRQASSSLKLCGAQQLEAIHLLQIEPLDRAVLWLIVYTFLPLISLFFLSPTSPIKRKRYKRYHTYTHTYTLHNHCFCLRWREKKKSRELLKDKVLLLCSYTDAVLSLQGQSKGRVLQRPHDAVSLITPSWLEHTKAARSLSHHAHNSPV